MRRQEEQDPIDSLMRAVAVQESQGTGDTLARNSRTNAYGRYQILPENWGPWSRDALGEEAEPTPENQEAVARHRMRQYVDRFGMEGALVAWYGGEGRAAQWVRNPDNPWFDRRHGKIDPETGEPTEPSVREYVNSIMSRITPAEPAQPQARVNADPFPISNPMSTENFAPRSSPAAAVPTAQEAPPTEAAPDRSAQLSTALKNAHAAGDTVAAQRLASEIVRLRGAGGARQEQQPQAPDAPLSPRERGRQSAEGIGFIGAAGQGVGSGLFGVGTPLTAAEAMIGSRLRGEPMEWADALEYARGRREGAWEEAPKAYGTGFVGSMVGGITGGARMLAKAPAAVQKLITPTRAAEGASRGARAANAAANTARYMGTGGASAGVTALNQEGVDAVGGATTMGAAMGPLAVGGIRAVGGGFNAVRNRIGDSGAMNIIANRVRAPAEVLEENLNRWNRSFEGTPGSAAQILDPRSAEEIALIAQGGRGARAGQVFRDAAQTADGARQTQVPNAIRRGGRTTSVEAETNALAPTQRDARALMRDTPTHNQPTERVGGRLQTTDDVVLRRRDARMDRVMGDRMKPETGIQGQLVPLTDDMLEVVMHADVQEALPPILRRRILKAVEEGTNVGSINLPVRVWDNVRLALGDRAGRGAAGDYSALRNKVRAYVGARVPEYGAALDEYARRSQVATGMATGRTALTQDVKTFSGKLRTVGGGSPDQPARPGEAAMNKLGARIGARTIFANALQENPERTLETLSQNGNMMQNLRRVLQPEEMRQLEDLAWRYGYQLRRVAGARAGAQGINVGHGTTEGFDAVASATRATREGATALEQSARGELADAAGKSPQAAGAIAEGMFEHVETGLHSRIFSAMGGDEAARLKEVGEAATLARRNLDIMTPNSTEAAQRAQAQAQDIQTAIGTFVITGGRASGAMIANVGQRLGTRLSMSPRSAERAAQLLVDPEQAPKIIAYLKARGISNNEIHKWYMESAAAAGIMTGAGAQGTGEERAEERGRLAPLVELGMTYPRGGGR